jgi:MIT (microtubule interacting and transport) domain
VHIQEAVALDVSGDAPRACVAYDRGVTALVHAVCALPVDEATRRYVWAKIGEYSVRSEELKQSLARRAPPASASTASSTASSTPLSDRLQHLRAFHAELGTTAFAGGYSSEHLRARLEELRGRPSMVMASSNKDLTWMREEEEAHGGEDEQVARILAAAMDELRVTEGSQQTRLEQPFLVALKNDLVKEATPNPATQDALLSEARVALQAAQQAVLQHRTESNKADTAEEREEDHHHLDHEDESSSEYSDERMEAARQQEKAHQRKMQEKTQQRLGRGK